jgi:hypothetical protein
MMSDIFLKVNIDMYLNKHQKIPILIKSAVFHFFSKTVGKIGLYIFFHSS